MYSRFMRRFTTFKQNSLNAYFMDGTGYTYKEYINSTFLNQKEYINSNLRMLQFLGITVGSILTGTIVLLNKDIKDLRNELKQDINELRTEIKQDIKELRTEVKQDIKELRTEVNNIKNSIDKHNEILNRFIYKINPKIADEVIFGKQK